MCGGGGGGQVQGPGPYEKELVDQSERRLDEYKEMYVPLEHQFLEDTQLMNTEWFKQGMTDTAVVSARNQLNPYGVQAGGGEQIKTQYAGGSQALAKAASASAGSGYQAGEDLYTGRMLEYVGVGRGQTGMGMNMYGQLAGNEAGYRQAEAHADQVVSNAKWNAAGTAAGFGFGAAAEKYGWFDPE